VTDQTNLFVFGTLKSRAAAAAAGEEIVKTPAIE
jgi:hypothetical protein